MRESIRFNPLLEEKLCAGFDIEKRGVHVVVIGAGGVGSFAIPAIMRTMKTLGLQDITIIDGDKVELKNIERQNFAHGDIGKNKAEVLATRYGNHFGLRAFYIPKFIQSSSHLQKTLRSCIVKETEIFASGGYSPYMIVISCVDNISTRQFLYHIFEVEKSFFDKFPLELVWIDSGNTEFSGQIIAKLYTHAALSSYELDNIFDNSIGETIFHLYPKMLEPIDDKPNPAMSCAIAGGDQTSLINRKVAYALEVFASKLLYSYAKPNDSFADNFHYYEVVGAHGASMIKLCANQNPLSLIPNFPGRQNINSSHKIVTIQELVAKAIAKGRPLPLDRKKWRAMLRTMQQKQLNFPKYDELVKLILGKDNISYKIAQV